MTLDAFVSLRLESIDEVKNAREITVVDTRLKLPSSLFNGLERLRSLILEELLLHPSIDLFDLLTDDDDVLVYD